MSNVKYKLTEKYIFNNDGTKLYQIKALKDFGNVKEGDLGGYIEKEDNLSQEGDAWVNDNAKVYDFAKVQDNAKVYGNAEVYGNALIMDEAQVYGNAYIHGNALVFGKSKVFDTADVRGNAWIYGYAVIYGNAFVCDNAKIYGDATICGKVSILNHTQISEQAQIHSNGDYMFVHGLGNDCNTNITFFRQKDASIGVYCNHIEGGLSRPRTYANIDEFVESIHKKYGNNESTKEYDLLVDLMKYHFNNRKDG